MFSGSFLKHKIYKVQFCFDNFFDLKKLSGAHPIPQISCHL